MLNQAVLFDLDGTLIDSVADIALCCNMALEISGLPKHPPQAYRDFIGWGAHKLVSNALGQYDEEFHQKVYEDYDTIYNDFCCNGCQMFQGIPQMLENLRAKGLKIAVVSNKPHKQTESVYLSTLNGYVDAYYGQLPNWPPKPDPCGVEYVLHKLGATGLAYVGDSEVDIATGNNAGLPTVGVTWGMKTKDFLQQQGAGQIADTPEELEKIIFNILDKTV